MIKVKILSQKSMLRYSAGRVVESACASLLSEYPDLQLDIQEISDTSEILKYTQVMVAPGLVMNEKLVSDLWNPKKEQVIEWLRMAIHEQATEMGDWGSRSNHP